MHSKCSAVEAKEQELLGKVSKALFVESAPDSLQLEVRMLAEGHSAPHPNRWRKDLLLAVECHCY